MKPKVKNLEMHKLYCISQLLLESLDVLKPTTQRMVKFKTDLIGLCELLNNDLADTATIQKSTYFHEMTAKIDTVIRKNFNENM